MSSKVDWTLIEQSEVDKLTPDQTSPLYNIRKAEDRLYEALKDDINQLIRQSLSSKQKSTGEKLLEHLEELEGTTVLRKLQVATLSKTVLLKQVQLEQSEDLVSNQTKALDALYQLSKKSVKAVSRNDWKSFL